MVKLIQYNKSGVFTLFLLILVVAVAFALLLYVTDNGIGISPDSTVYIDTANSLLEGDGFYANGEPMTQYPPLYPIILAISGSFTSNITDSARWLHVIIYCINAILFGLLIFINTNRNTMAMITGFLLFLSSSIVLKIHSYAWSESPFIMFSFLSFFLLYIYISTKHWLYLFISSISLGLAIATRYVGIALIPPILISIVLFVKRPIKQLFKDILIILFIAALPISVWVVRNLITTHSATNRSFIYHPISINNVTSRIFTFYSHFLPSSGFGWIISFVILIIICSLFFIVYVLYKKRDLFNQSQNISLVFISIGILFVLSYFAVILFSLTFFDAATPLDSRLLLPVYLIFLISLFLMVFLFSSVVHKKILWLIFITGVIVLIGINIPSVFVEAGNFHANGIGYNSLVWNESSTLAKLNSIHSEVQIISNGSDVIRFKLGYEATSIPAYYSSGSLVENKNYNEQLFSMCGSVEGGKAILVYLDGMTWRKYFPSKKELLTKCELPILYDTADGTIYGLLDK